MSPTSEQRLRELVADLEPVRPLPRLRIVAAAVVGVWLLATVLERLLGGPPLLPESSWGDAGFLWPMAGLAAVAVGSSLAALASGVPGRERAARTGLGVAVGGLGALAVGLGAGAAEPAAGLALPWYCIARSAWVGLAPALVLMVFAGRALALSPARTALGVWGGAIALGAVAVQASCRDAGAWHVALGHAGGPLLAAVLLALPAGLWLRRRAAASREPIAILPT